MERRIEAIWGLKLQERNWKLLLGKGSSISGVGFRVLRLRGLSFAWKRLGV